MTAVVTSPTTQATTEEPAEGASIPPPSTDGAAAEPSEAASGAGEAPPAQPSAEDKVKLAAKTIARAKAAGQRARELEAKAEREALRASQLSERLQQEQRERAREREEREAWKKDPLSAVKGLGLTARQLAAKALEEGTPEARFAALEAQLMEEREARTKLEQKIAAEQQTAAQRKATADFLARVTPETFPSLSRLPPRRLLALARDAFADATERGYTFRDTDTEILEALESEFAPHSAVAGTSKPKTNPAGNTVAGTVAKPPPVSRTVTADLSGRKYTLPANFDDLDDFDQKKAMARMLEEAHTPTGS